MPDSLRHVSIHCGWAPETGHGATVDLSLPAALTVGELLPWIVDAVGAGGGAPRRWQLAYLGGRSLDESATLVQNDIRDGDLLLLAELSEQPRPERPVIAALTVESPDDGIPVALRSAGCLWACALGILAFAWAGLGSHGLDRVAAAVVAAAVTAVAVGAHHLSLDSTIAATLDVAAVAQAAILGFLVVPAGPAPANFFLAAVAAGSLAAVLIRISGCATEILLAIVTAAGTVAVATGGAALFPLAAPGAVVSAFGVGLLPLAPRLSIALAGLTPPAPGYPGTEVDTLDGNAFDADAQARRGHRYLVGLVLGCSVAAALGTGILAVSALRRVTAVEVAFAAAVGVALLLRSRTYTSGRCRTGLIISGFCSLTTAFILVVAWDPGHGSWIGILAVGAGTALLWPITVQNPMAARLADTVEYAALAVVVPLACWLTGAFDLVRGLGPQ